MSAVGIAGTSQHESEVRTLTIILNLNRGIFQRCFNWALLIFVAAFQPQLLPQTGMRISPVQASTPSSPVLIDRAA